MTKLAALAAGVDVNAPDAFGRRALDYAMEQRDDPMARALLERGADPNLVAEDEPSPLAIAIDRGQFDLARLMEAKGARMTGSTGLCDLPRVTFVDPNESPENRKCSWAGLLIAKGQFDRLDELARAGDLEAPPVREAEWTLPRQAAEPVVAVDTHGELQAAFFKAVEGGDARVVGRLLPHVGRGSMADHVLGLLYEQNRHELLRRYVADGHGADAARSDAEARVWRAAARAGRDEALAFLRDYGADLNRLTTERLAACERAAGEGRVDLLWACVQEAGERRARLDAALASPDRAAASALIAEAADVRERNKATLLQLAAGAGRPDLIRDLLARGAPVATGGYVQGSSKPVYAGALKAQADAWAEAAGYRAAQLVGQSAVVRAALRGDRESLRLLVDAGAPGLLVGLSALSGAGNPPPGMRDWMGLEGDDDSSGLPSGPGADKLAAYRLLAAETARALGPQALERPFASAVYSGYDDLLVALRDAGFDASKAKEPERIWSNWGSLGTPCKPSTGRQLILARLPTDYPPSEYSNWPPLHSLAAGCRNSRSIPVLVQSGVDVNKLSVEGETALDVAQRYRREHLAAALRALGGKTAAEVAPLRVKRDAERARAEDDLDLEQSERQ